MTKTDEVRKLLQDRSLSLQHVATMAGVPLKQVYVIYWRMRHPTYNRDKMREYRARAE